MDKDSFPAPEDSPYGPSADVRTAAGSSFPSTPRGAGTPARWEPKRLTPRHKQILAFVAQGMGREEISRICGCTPQLVTALMGSELAREHIGVLNAAVDLRLQALQERSVDVIAEAMGADQPMETRLKGARLQLDATGRLAQKGQGGSGATAEDVVAKLLQINVQVNTG